METSRRWKRMFCYLEQKMLANQLSLFGFSRDDSLVNMVTLNQYTVILTRLTGVRSPSTFGTPCIHRAARRLSRSVRSSCSGRTGSSWSTASATAQASRWCASRCSSSAKWGSSLRRCPSSLWETRGTFNTRESCRAKRAGCSPCLLTAASSKYLQQRLTTASSWSSMNCWSSSKRPGPSRREWPELRAL